MIKTIGEYQIEINYDETYNNKNANLSKYDYVYDDNSGHVLPTMFRIKTFKDNELLKSAIIASIGGGMPDYKNTTIFESERILVCCSNSIFCLSIPELNLVWKRQADHGWCFGIYKYQDSYIVHGEVEISRIGKDGNIIWQKSGADIFTTKSGEKSFELTDDFIIANDFENRVYKWSYDGEEFTDETQFF